MVMNEDLAVHSVQVVPSNF